MARKSKSQLELEAKLAAQAEQMEKLLKAFERSEQDKQVLQNLVTARQTHHASAAQASGLMVGVRNVSNYTIGLTGSPLPNEPDITLHAEGRDGFDPNSTALVSWAWWQKLRRTELPYGRGMIIRDDSLLAPDAIHAPEDSPREVHPDHEKNVVIDARAFIEELPESEIRRRIAAMTSEESLRRLHAQIDARVGEEQAKYPDTDDERAQKAVNALPSIYQLAENLILNRIQELDTKDPF